MFQLNVIKLVWVSKKKNRLFVIRIGERKLDVNLHRTIKVDENSFIDRVDLSNI